MASLAVSHQGLALSQWLSHPVGACDALVSHHVICHLTCHMTSPMIHHMTCTWHIMWLITWPLDLEKEHQVHAARKSRKTKKNVPWGRSSHIHNTSESNAYLSPKTTRGWDGDSGWQTQSFIHDESDSHTVTQKTWPMFGTFDLWPL
jgi:hypothetical protein